MTATLLTSGYN